MCIIQRVIQLVLPSLIYPAQNKDGYRQNQRNQRYNQRPETTPADGEQRETQTVPMPYGSSSARYADSGFTALARPALAGQAKEQQAEDHREEHNAQSRQKIGPKRNLRIEGILLHDAQDGLAEPQGTISGPGSGSSISDSPE